MNPLIAEINETEVVPGALRIWWLGQEGFAIKSQNCIIYIDPYIHFDLGLAS